MTDYATRRNRARKRADQRRNRTRGSGGHAIDTYKQHNGIGILGGTDSSLRQEIGSAWLPVGASIGGAVAGGAAGGALIGTAALPVIGTIGGAAIGALVGGIGGLAAGLLPTVNRVADQTGESFGQAAGQVYGGVGKGFVKSVGSTAGSLLPPGGLEIAERIPASRKFLEEIPAEWRPESFSKRARERGIVSAAIEDVGNVAMVGGLVGGIAGRAAEGARTAAGAARAARIAEVAEKAATPYRTAYRAAEGLAGRAQAKAVAATAAGEEIGFGTRAGTKAHQGFVYARTVGQARQAERTAIAARSAAYHEPSVAAQRAVARSLVREHGLDRRTADLFVGQEIHDRATIDPWRAAKGRIQSELTAAGVDLNSPDVHPAIRTKDRIAPPPEMLGPDGKLLPHIDRELQRASDLYSDVAVKKTQTLLQSRLGTKGLEAMGRDFTMPSPRVEKMYSEWTRYREDARRHAAEIPAERAKLLEEVNRLYDRAQRIKGRKRAKIESEVERLRARLERNAGRRTEIDDEIAERLLAIEQNRAYVPDALSHTRIDATADAFTAALLENEGVSMSPKTAKLYDAEAMGVGYATGLVKDTDRFIEATPETTPEVLRARVREWLGEKAKSGQLSNPENYIGGWVQKDDATGAVIGYHLDPSAIYPDRDLALAIAAQHSQISSGEIGGPLGFDEIKVLGAADAASKLWSSRSRMRVSRELRESIGRTRLSIDDVDGLMALGDVMSVQAWRNDPKQFPTPDAWYKQQTYKTMRQHADKTPPPKAGVTRLNRQKLLFEPMDAKRLAKLAKENERYKDWYIETSDRVTKEVGGTLIRLADGREVPADDVVFQLLAQTSPDTSVKANTTFARNALRAWVESNGDLNALDDVAFRYGTHRDTVKRIFSGDTMDRWPTPDEGTRPKTTSFYLNLKHARDPEHVTVDVWMARLFGADTVRPTAGKEALKTGKTGLVSVGYEQARDAIRATAKHLTDMTGEEWVPSQVQAALWGYAKDEWARVIEVRWGNGEGRALTDGNPPLPKVRKRAMEMLELERSEALDKKSIEQVDADIAKVKGAKNTAEIQAVANKRIGRAKALRNAESYEKFFGDAESWIPRGSDATRYLHRLSNDVLLASVEFAPDAKSLVRMYEHADLRAIVHENGHMLRRALGPDLTPIVERHYGVKDGKWEVAHEEAFAQDFEMYMRNGKAPRPDLVPLFDQLKVWLTQMYAKVREYVGLDVHPEIQDTLDQWFTAGDPVTGYHGTLTPEQVAAEGFKPGAVNATIAKIEKHLGLQAGSLYRHTAGGRDSAAFFSTDRASAQGYADAGGEAVRKAMGDAYRKVHGISTDATNRPPDVPSFQEWSAKVFEDVGLKPGVVEAQIPERAAARGDENGIAVRSEDVGRPRVSKAERQTPVGPEAAPDISPPLGPRGMFQRGKVEGGHRADVKALQREAAILSRADEQIGSRIGRLESDWVAGSGEARRFEAMARRRQKLAADPTNLESGRAYEKAVRNVERVEKLINTHLNDITKIKLSDVPAVWQPAVENAQGLYQEVVKAVGGGKIGALTGMALLEGVPRYFTDIVKVAAAHGFEPQHFRNFTPQQMQRFLNGGLRLGHRGPSDTLSEMESGTRKLRAGSSYQDKERSIGAIIAAQAEAGHEAATNSVIDAVETHWAQPLVLGPDGKLPPGMVAWSQKKGELIGRVHGDVPPPEAELMIPQGVMRVLNSYSKDLPDNAIVNALYKTAKPWRAMILLGSPRWYLNNIVGNVVLASQAMADSPGNAARAWFEAWKESGGFRSQNRIAALAKRNPEKYGHLVNEGMVRRFPNTPAELLSNPGVKAMTDDIIGPSVVPREPGVAGMKQAHAEGVAGRRGRMLKTRALREVLSEVAERLQRANSFVDELARTAVFKHAEMSGADAATAVNKAVQAMVDYTGMGPYERTLVRTAMPFYAWQRGILMTSMKLAVDHPVRAAATMLIGRINTDLLGEEYAALPEFYQGGIPGPGGTLIAARGFNPFMDALEILTPEGAASALTPVLEAMVRDGWNVRELPYGPLEEGPSGYPRPDVRAGEVLRSAFTRELPQVQALRQLGAGIPVGIYPSGKNPPSALQSAGKFLGINVRTEEDVERILKRLPKARKAIEASRKSEERYRRKERARAKARYG